MLNEKDLQAKKEEMWNLTDEYEKVRRGLTWEQRGAFRERLDAIKDEINETLRKMGEDTVQWETGSTPGSA